MNKIQTELVGFYTGYASIGTQKDNAASELHLPINNQIHIFNGKKDTVLCRTNV